MMSIKQTIHFEFENKEIQEKVNKILLWIDTAGLEGFSSAFRFYIDGDGDDRAKVSGLLFDEYDVLSELDAYIDGTSGKDYISIK